MNVIPPKTPGKVNYRGYTPGGTKHVFSFDERTPLVTVLRAFKESLCTLCVSDSGSVFRYDGMWHSSGQVTEESRARAGVVRE